MESSDPLRRVLEKKGNRVITVVPQDTVFHALSVLAEHNIGAVLVMEAAEPVGMFSERDYARKIALLGRVSKETRVSEVMSRPLVTVPPDFTVDMALAFMSERHLRHLPVIEDGRVLGMVSIGDLVSWIISAQTETIRQLHAYIAGHYPG